ncbi:hypothetical protein [Paraburkholderia sp. BL10I2N1]|uniref:hypothetical protein n=1 Tax=Paraburkholderia sp. BL10I2N1 TaxID=1938796 RepID=UPI001FB677E3|nr:hypothetical protein [Paraburkholderia sp. BL10I2N1]
MNAYVEQGLSRAQLSEQPAYARLFLREKLTVGLILPLETHPNRPAPTMRDHVTMAQKADSLGFAALWMRDVPFYDPDYGDVGQIRPYSIHRLSRCLYSEDSARDGRNCLANARAVDSCQADSFA